MRDFAQIHELKNRIGNTKQQESSLTFYYNKLQSLWQKVDHYQYFEMESARDTVKLKKLLDPDWIFEFLAGLNPELDRSLNPWKGLSSPTKRGICSC